MADEQDQAEQLDDDEMGGEFPPDKMLGAQAYGAAGTEPGAPESVAQRAGREIPDQVPLDPLPTSSDPEAVLSGDEAFGDDPTMRDVVQEREAPLPAEEAAMHVVDDDFLEVESQVDDPDLAAALAEDPDDDLQEPVHRLGNGELAVDGPEADL